ncbi:hypothetical protein BT96DRAFT_929115, partial [Gymnopus androsaceus JB14]
MFRFSNLAAVFSILLLINIQAMTVRGVECGWEGAEPLCASDEICCGPLLEANGTVYGTCYPKGGACP